MSTLRIKCPTCDRQLELPQEARGKVAKCPACEETFRVPEADGLDSSQKATPSPAPTPFSGIGSNDSGRTPNDPFAGVSPPGSASAATNPYQTPNTTSPQIQPINPGQIRPVDFGVIWDVGLAIFKARCVPLIGIFALGTIGIYIAQFIANIIIAVVPPVAIITVPGFMVIQIIFQLMLALATIRTCRGENLAFDAIFPPAHNIYRFTGVSLIFTAALLAILGIPMVMIFVAGQGGNGGALVGIGVLVIVFLGLIFGLLATFYAWSVSFVFNEPGVTMRGGVGRAIEITNANKLTVLLLLVASTALSILGILACGVGLFVAAPLSLTLFGTAYLLITGQGVNDPRAINTL